MHPFLFGVFHHALVVVVVAFFVLFAASKADGFVKLLGNVLGYLLLLLAVLLVVWLFAAPLFGWHPLPFHPCMMHGLGPCGQPPVQGPPPVR